MKPTSNPDGRVHTRALYSQLVKYYDRIYWWKDYDQEVDFLVKALKKYDVRGNRILEVACGTGSHTKILVERGYEVKTLATTC
jgi:ubiquinone/menaquinone biosynthesis C-methylase UbiE